MEVLLLLTIQIIQYKFSAVHETLTCMRCSNWMIAGITILCLIPNRRLSVGKSVDFNL